MQENRPRIKMIPSGTDRLLDILSFAGLILLWVYVIVEYSSLPAVIPVHFNFKGNIDSYGSKATIFILPGIISIVVIGLTLLGRVPHVLNYPQRITPENAPIEYARTTRVLRIIKLVIVIFVCIITIYAVRSAKERTSELPGWILPAFILSMILPVGIYIYRSYRNRKKDSST